MNESSYIKNSILHQSYKNITVSDSPYNADNIMVIFANTTGGAITINLPDAAVKNGATYQIKKTDTSSYTVTIDGYGSQTIDGDTTKILRSPQETVNIISDGSNWKIANSSSSAYLILSTPSDGNNITLDGTKNVILCNNTGNINLTLPAVSGYVNKSITIKKLSATGSPSQIITVLTAGGEYIDQYSNGGTPLKIYTQYTSYTLLSDGSKWHIIGG